MSLQLRYVEVMLALDTPPVLLTLDAELEIQNAAGSRRVPLDNFFVDYYETAIEDGEILTKILIPKLPRYSGGKYRAMTPRQGDYAIAGVCVRLTLDEKGICAIARIGLTNGETYLCVRKKRKGY